MTPHRRVEPRIAPGSRTEVGTFAWAFAHLAGRVIRSDPPHLFLTMGRRPALFRGWLRFAARLTPRGRLPRRETELVILRVAHLRDCAYEFEHHVRLGRRNPEFVEVVDGLKPGEKVIVSGYEAFQKMDRVEFTGRRGMDQ